MAENAELRSEDLGAHLTESLAQVPRGPFSPAAFDVLKGKTAQYATDLARGAEKLAADQKADIVSAWHVERTAESLTTSSSSKALRRIGAGGGVLVGAAISQFLTVTSTTSPIAMVIAGVVGMIGAIAVAIQWAKE